MHDIPRIQLLLAALIFFLCAAFHPGGGWNQNARFAQIRAIVEEGTFNIDHYLLYTAGTGPQMHRIPTDNGRAVLAHGPVRLCWRDKEWKLTPIAPGPPVAGEKLVALDNVAASGDVSFSSGHFYPNKPPGLSILAAPVYALLFSFDREMGWSPDDWWILTVNAWATSALCVGVISALAAVVLFRIARRFAPVPAALGIAVAYALGTMAWPYGAMLFDQNITAAALLLAFALLMRAALRDEKSPWDPALAGFSAGMAVLCNYVAGPVLFFLFFYARKRDRLHFISGTLVPLTCFAAYHLACFGGHLCTTTQNPLFNATHTGPVLLGMFSFPNPWVSAALLFSPFRGLFYSSPILLLAVWGLWRWFKSQPREALFCTSIFGLFFAVNSCFEGWHGGYGVAPRYLGPAIPFLCLGLVAIWRRIPKLCLLVTCASVLFQFAFVATDPLSPVGTGSIARYRTQSDWSYNPLFSYAVPYLLAGRPWPILNRLVADYVRQEETRFGAAGMVPKEHAAEVAWLRDELQRSVNQGDSMPFTLAAFDGPVSVNPVGICEGSFFRLFQPHSIQAQWNAFNIGEFFYPGSRWSLLPIVALGATLFGFALFGSRVKPTPAGGSAGSTDFPALREPALKDPGEATLNPLR